MDFRDKGLFKYRCRGTLDTALCNKFISVTY